MLGQHARVQPLGQPAQLLHRSPELVLGVGDLLSGLLASGRSLAAAQGRRQLPELSLGPLVQATLQPPAFLVPCRKDPPARCGQLLDAGLHLGPQPGVGGRQLRRGGDRLHQPRVLQHRRVVDQDGDRLALALHESH